MRLAVTYLVNPSLAAGACILSCGHKHDETIAKFVFMLQSHCHVVAATLYLQVDPHVVNNFVSISAACHVVPRSSHAIASL
jgi:hypothetical protein